MLLVYSTWPLVVACVEVKEQMDKNIRENLKMRLDEMAILFTISH